MNHKIVGSKILITGGAGFIGSHLCDYFLKDNEVICLDNLSTGFESNIQHLYQRANFKFIKGNICDYKVCEESMVGVDLVLHQAALGSVPRSIENPLATNENNVNGFLNILEAARNAKVKNFVFAASSSTYGDSVELPKVESRIGKPLSPYAVSKLTNELYAHVFANLYQMNIIGLRYFNVFGPRQSPNGAYAAVIPRFIESVKNSEDLIIHGDGKQTRDFTFIDNVVKANELAAIKCNSMTGYEVYNIACGSQITINELAQFIIEHSKIYFKDSNSKIKYVDSRIGDIKDSLASIDKAKNELNYEPEIDVREGLRLLLSSIFQ